MSRKFQGLAKTMCEIFLGHQSYEDLPKFMQLGKGKYEIDILTTISKKDGNDIESFKISEVLQKWFLTRLRMENIPLEKIQKAVLVVEVTEIQERSIGFILERFRLSQITFECTSYINAYDREYFAQDSERKEFV
jgi:hypothetical protein